jgi:transglutaminase-like putative cysteine protease
MLGMAGSYKTARLGRANAGVMRSTSAASRDNPGEWQESAEAVCLAPAEYIDSHHPLVAAQAARLRAAPRTERDTARAIYYFVRDLTYEGGDFEDLEIYRASSVLAAGHGYCVGKASLCAALARAVGIPARIGFADVRNHLASPRLLQAMGTDIFAWHGYTGLLLGGRWIKVSPTFDIGVCQRVGVAALEFDGEHDAMLQSFDGASSMRYVREHGVFHDVPARFLAAEMQRLYPFTREHGVSRFIAGGQP